MSRNPRFLGRTAPILHVASLLFVLSAAPSARARPSGAAGPPPALRSVEPSRSAAIFDDDDRMDVNNLDMFVTNHGSLAWDLVTGNSGLIYPKGTTKTAVFAAGLWIGAEVGGQTRATVGEYSQEYVPGPMAGGTFQPDQPSFKNFRFDRDNPLTGQDLTDYLAQGGPTDSLGNPQLLGDATIWSVFNDADPGNHTNVAGSTAPLGVEVQQSTFAYNRAGALGYMIFLKFRIANKGTEHLDRAYFGLWSDPDLGGSTDDLVGCDTTLSLGYCYNANNNDQLYGSAPPAVGFALLQGPRVEVSPGVTRRQGSAAFARYENGTDPQSAVEAYRRLQGLDLNGDPIHVGDDPSQPVTRYEVSGDPVTGTGWLDGNPSDRRMLLSCGPFPMAPGDVQEIVFAVAVGQGPERLSSLTALRAIVPVARAVWRDLATPLVAAVNIDPDVINLVSRSPWVTVALTSGEFDVAAIDPSTVRLAGVVPAEPGSATVGERDGTTELVVKFPRASLDPLVAPGVQTLVATGQLVTGESFQGDDEVRVVDPTGRGVSIAPNPLNPTGTIAFRTNAPGPATVTLHDVRGRRVRMLLETASLPSGLHRLDFDGRADGGGLLGSGLYFVRVMTHVGQRSGRVVLLK